MIADREIARLRRAISCLSPMVLLGLPQPNAGSWLTRLATPPATVATTPRRSITFIYEFAVDKARQVTDRQTVPIAYRYVLFDENGSEILAYHWHPTGTSQIVTPHLHVSARHGDLDLSPAHLPTGVVSPIAFVRALITEFGVEPLRADWDVVLIDG